MNYRKIYDSIISRGRLRDSIDGYSEIHHIVPYCMGGIDHSTNTVALTAREHFIAHALLYKIFGGSKLAHAWHMMTISDKNQDRYFNSRLYEMAKVARSIELSKQHSGEGNHFFGKTHSKQSKKKISLKRRLKETSQQTRDKMSATRMGVPKSKEHREKLGRKGRVVVTHLETGRKVRLKRRHFARLGPESRWKAAGYFSASKKYQCRYCSMVTNKINITRWHNENCKQAPKLERPNKVRKAALSGSV